MDVWCSSDVYHRKSFTKIFELVCHDLFPIIRHNCVRNTKSSEEFMQKSNCTTTHRVFTFQHLWPFQETVNHYSMILSFHWTCKINVQPWPWSVHLWPQHKLWCLCCYRAILVQKHSYLLKLSSSLYGDDPYGSLLVFFFSALLVSEPICHSSKFYHRWKKIFSPLIFLYCWSIICFFFSVIYLSIFALFLISSIVTGNSRMVLQSTLFISISNFRFALTVFSNGSHDLEINLNNPTACPNLLDGRNFILKL